jgi:hypothetical protein
MDAALLDGFEAQLSAAARHGEYEYVLTFMDDPARYAHLVRDENRTCAVAERVCSALTEEAAREDGPVGAAAARRKRLIGTGCLQFAVDIITRNAQGCADAVMAGCQLIAAALRGAEPVVLVLAFRDGALSTVLDVVARDFVSGSGGQVERPAEAYRACCDALLAIAGLHFDVPPHAVAAAFRRADPSTIWLNVCWKALQHENSILTQIFAHSAWAAKLLELGPVHSSDRRTLMRLLRSAGRLLRLLQYAAFMRMAKWPGNNEDMMRTIFDDYLVVELHNQDDCAFFQRWAIVYGLLPLACVAQQRSEDIDEMHGLPSFCLARCCIARCGSSELWVHDALLWFDCFHELIIQAANLHDSCVRPVARLICWLARGNGATQAFLKMAGAGAEEVLRTYISKPRRASAVSTAAAADDDPDGGADGECLSEWGSDNEDGEPPRVTSRTESTRALVARALRALEGKSSEDIEARRAAADAAAASLLAELEGETRPAAAASGGAKKKKKKKKGAAKKAAPKAGPASDADQSDDDAAAGDEGPADVLAALSAPAAGPPPPAPAPAEAPPPAAAVSKRATPQPRGRLGAMPCGCGDAACATPASHAAPARADAAIAELFPWLSMQDEQKPAQPKAPPAKPAAPIVDAPHEDDDLCVICLDEPRDTPLAGCGAAHPPALCSACAARVLTAAAPVCPLCRAPTAAV